MTRETSNKLSAKKEQMKKTKKAEELSKKKKQHIDSDDEGDDDFISESDSDEMDVHEYRKFLNKIFPSKHLDKKVAAGEKIKKIYEKLEEADEEWETDDDEESILVQKQKLKLKPRKLVNQENQKIKN